MQRMQRIYNFLDMSNVLFGDGKTLSESPLNTTESFPRTRAQSFKR